MSVFFRIPFVGDFEMEYPSTSKGLAYFDTVLDEKTRCREVWIAHRLYMVWDRPTLLPYGHFACLAVMTIGAAAALFFLSSS